jgi:hypothetical protein
LYFEGRNVVLEGKEGCTSREENPAKPIDNKGFSDYSTLLDLIKCLPITTTYWTYPE